MAIIKTFKQISYDNPNTLPSPSTNILDASSAVTLGIHALPGTTFSIMQNGSAQFKIGPTGNLALDCSENPIKELYLIKSIEHSGTIMYPIIIDIEYLTEGGNS